MNVAPIMRSAPDGAARSRAGAPARAPVGGAPAADAARPPAARRGATRADVGAHARRAAPGGAAARWFLGVACALDARRPSAYPLGPSAARAIAFTRDASTAGSTPSYPAARSARPVPGPGHPGACAARSPSALVYGCARPPCSCEGAVLTYQSVREVQGFPSPAQRLRGERVKGFCLTRVPAGGGAPRAKNPPPT